jgi:hypothetical protein
MMNFRKIAAASKGRLVMRYFTEGRPEPNGEAPALDLAGRELADGDRLTAYYTGEDSRAVWRRDMPKALAEAIGINPAEAPRDKELVRLFEGKRADNGEAWSDHKRKLSGFDIVFSPDKSVSLAAEFAPTAAERALIWQSLSRASDRAMRYLAQEIGWARSGHQGSDGAEPGAVGWVTFGHHTARPTLQVQDRQDGETYLMEAPVAGDPHIHFHNFLMNVVVTADGRVGSLDTRRLTDGKVKEIGAYFQAVLADDLRRHGIDVRMDKDNQAVVVDAIPEEAKTAFSKRDRQILHKAKNFAQEQGLVWDEMSAEKKLEIVEEASAEGRLGKIKLDERKSWRAEAEAMGWRHRSVLGETAHRPLPEEERLETAYRFAAARLAEEFKTAAVIDHDKLGMYAARGLIGAGIDGGPDDIRKVVERLETRGIEIAGEQVALVSGLSEGRLRVTHTAQIRLEEKLMVLARAAARDKAGALDEGGIQAALASASHKFTAEQIAAVRALASGGAITLLTGVAGAGKTTLLEPLVQAWGADQRFSPEGRRVVGAAMAWRQAEALRDAGITETYAVSNLLSKVESGEFKPDRNTVLVLDEASQIGPRPLVKLLELQARTGMTIKMLGDREQAQAIEAGDSVELLRRALPPEALPEVLTTMRQSTRRARRITSLFRQGEAGEALALKRADGHAFLVGGDFDEVVGKIADLYIARRDILQATGAGRGITVSAPTNDDAAEISRAIRRRLKARGEVRGREVTYAAIDQRGHQYEIRLATGDQVRLFRQVWGTVKGGGNRQIGSNGDVVEVISQSAEGLRVRNKKGEVADVAWRRLRDEKTGRLMLSYGYVLTIDAAQGLTSDEHINALPRGTAGVTAFTAYVAESRSRGATWTMISSGALNEAERRRQAMGEITPITEKTLWERAAADMAQKPYKALGIDLADKAVEEREAAIESFIQSNLVMEEAARTRPDAGRKAFSRLRAAAINDALERHVMALDEALAAIQGLIRDAAKAAEASAHLRQMREQAASAAARMEQASRPSPGPSF